MGPLSVLHFCLQSGRNGILPKFVRHCSPLTKPPSQLKRVLAVEGIKLALFSVPPEKYHSLPSESPFAKLLLARLN